MLGAVGPEASPRLEQGESHAYIGADGGQGWNRCADCILGRDAEPPGTLILSPGRVWSEPGDGGLSRASLPFVLLEGAGARNGLATFLYDDNRVSAWRFQIVQENVPWRDKYDGWGQADIRYTPGPIAAEYNRQAVLDDCQS